jgi:hypothetical protein
MKKLTKYVYNQQDLRSKPYFSPGPLIWIAKSSCERVQGAEHLDLAARPSTALGVA